jgi:hypothetical protein
LVFGAPACTRRCAGEYGFKAQKAQPVKTALTVEGLVWLASPPSEKAHAYKHNPKSKQTEQTRFGNRYKGYVIY